MALRNKISFGIRKKHIRIRNKYYWMEGVSQGGFVSNFEWLNLAAVFATHLARTFGDVCGIWTRLARQFKHCFRSAFWVPGKMHFWTKCHFVTSKTSLGRAHFLVYWKNRQKKFVAAIKAESSGEDRHTRHGGTPFGGWGWVVEWEPLSPVMRASPSFCRVLTIDWQVRGLCRCLWYARGLCVCPWQLEASFPIFLTLGSIKQSNKLGGK